MPGVVQGRSSEGALEPAASPTSRTSLTAARPGKRALLVGINAYPRHPLRGCVNDVAAVRDFLIAERGFAAEQITALCDGEATRAAILRELEAAVAATKRSDCFVFYFCGHGAQLASEDPREPDLLDEVLCPIDFAWTPATAIVDDELQRIFDAFPVGASLTWVFDACHTGDIDEELDARLAYRGLPERALGASERPASAAPTVSGAAAGASSPRILSPSGRTLVSHRGVILTACAATERAADILVDDVPRGAFTYHLLAAARGAPGALTSAVLASATDALATLNQHPEGYGPGLSSPFINVREPAQEHEVKRSQTRTVRIAANPSADADRHLHAYLAEASRLAQVDEEFSSQLSRYSLDLSNISAGDASALARAVKPAPRSSDITCRSFWWGFHLEVPRCELESLAQEGINHLTLARRIQLVPHRASLHLGSLVEYVVKNFESVRKIDRGAGVFVSMSSFAPDVYVTTAVPVRAPARRAAEAGESCSVRM